MQQQHAVCMCSGSVCLTACVLCLVCLAVDFFDASGTLFAMANFINNFIPGEPLALPAPCRALPALFLVRTCERVWMCMLERSSVA